MKILQINSCHFNRGGADIVYLNTGELLEKKGNQVVYFSQNDSRNRLLGRNEFFIEKIDYFNASLLKRIYSLPRFYYSFESKKNIKYLIEKYEPDVAHIHLYKANLTPSILHTLKSCKVPIILTLHDYGLLCPHNLLLDGNNEICHKCINKSTLHCIINKCNRKNLLLSAVSATEFIFHKTVAPFFKYFDKIIAVSKFGQDLHNNAFGGKKQVEHLYNFFPNIEVEPDNKKGNYFLYFGRLSKEKGLNTLITAWQTKSITTVLKIVGTGPIQEELSKQITSKNIEMLGFKTGHELSELIRKASFIIVPSECYENNPLTIIEAYANGKPVIGSNVGGIPEIIEDGSTGFIFQMKSVIDLADKIEIAENIDRHEYELFSANARAFAEKHFHPEKHYQSLMSIYNNAIQEYGK